MQICKYKFYHVSTYLSHDSTGHEIKYNKLRRLAHDKDGKDGLNFQWTCPSPLCLTYYLVHIMYVWRRIRTTPFSYFCTLPINIIGLKSRVRGHMTHNLKAGFSKLTQPSMPHGRYVQRDFIQSLLRRVLVCDQFKSINTVTSINIRKLCYIFLIKASLMYNRIE